MKKNKKYQSEGIEIWYEESDRKTKEEMKKSMWWGDEKKNIGHSKAGDES